MIEAAASGISAAQELQNRYGDQDFAIQLCPVRDGSKWRLKSDSGVDYGGNIATKKLAVELAVRAMNREAAARDTWDAKFATIELGVEGVDFRYADGGVA